jgi:acetoacetyl-CoA synthetase
VGDGEDQAPEAGRDYGDVLWVPTAESAKNAEVTRYARWLTSRGGPVIGGAAPGELASYRDLWQWSVDALAEFWTSIWDFFGVLGSRGDGPVLAGEMPNVTWFDGSTLNYARNALFRAAAPAERTAVIYQAETGRAGTLSYGELRAEVGRVQAGLRQLGVGVGDRVAAYLPNSPEALIAMLATTSLGAIWTSCSPDFGAHSVIDRFAQITPKVLFGVDGYVYNGTSFDRRPELAAIAAGLDGLQAVVMVDYVGSAAAMTGLPPGVTVLDWASFGPSPSSPTCRSAIRCGCCTPRAPPGCPSRSCMATAASFSSTSRRSLCIRT